MITSSTGFAIVTGTGLRARGRGHGRVSWPRPTERRRLDCRHIGCAMLDLIIIRKYPAPFILCLIERGLNALHQLSRGICIPETEKLVASAVTSKFIVKLGENEFEDFLENIYSALARTSSSMSSIS